jgi:hypothetical protein
MIAPESASRLEGLHRFVRDIHVKGLSRPEKALAAGSGSGSAPRPR